MMTLNEKAVNLPPNAKTPPKQLIAAQAAVKSTEGVQNIEPATSDPSVLEQIWKIASMKQKNR